MLSSLATRCSLFMARHWTLPTIAAFVSGVAVGAYWTRRQATAASLQEKLAESAASRSTCDTPENAPPHCPGVESDAAGKAEACEGCPNRLICASGEARGDSTAKLVGSKLGSVKHVVLVLSGKGGVGKSTVATQLAWVLQDADYNVGLLDIDICGPSIPRMTGTQGEGSVHMSKDGWSPVYATDRLAVMSIGYLLPEPDDAIVWRGPKKNGLIRQFLTDVIWGDLDYLIIDTPPGTSDEHLSVVSYLAELGVDGAILVTMPQEVSLQDVRKEINFCKRASVKVLGVVENFKGSTFDAGQGNTVATCELMQVPYAGSMPMEADVLLACEKGRSLSSLNLESPALQFLKHLAHDILQAAKVEV